MMDHTPQSKSNRGKSILSDMILIFVISQLLKAPKIVGSGSGSITFEGVGMKLDETNNLVFPLVVGSPNSYSWFSEEAISDYPLAIGEELVLVAGLEVTFRSKLQIVNHSLGTEQCTYCCLG